MQNFKVRVVGNIDGDSEGAFGKVGSILSVEDGELWDNDGFGWSNDGKYFHSIWEVNNYFSNAFPYSTVFELVEEGE